MTKGTNTDKGVPPRTGREVLRSFRLAQCNRGANEDTHQQ